MQQVTIKAYAVSHKLSIFNVMKMVKSGKLKTEVVEENGKETTYILLDDETEKEIKEQIIPLKEKVENRLAEEVQSLRKEVVFLRQEIETLKKRI